jgi:uncharacterized protein YkwD
MTAKIKSHTTGHQNRHRNKPKGISSHSFEKVYWPYIPLLIIASFIMAAGIQNGVLQKSLRNPIASFNKVLSYATNLNNQDLLSSTNVARLSYDRNPLKLNPLLSKAAQAKANDMALKNYWSHNTPSGNPPWVFVSAVDYSYDKLGENLAAGFTDAPTTIDGWMASPSHKDNMLDDAYTEVGFGFANNPNYTSTGNEGPMTIVVAYYGKPAISAASLDRGSSIALASASNNQSPGSTTVASTTASRLNLPAPSPTILIALLFLGIGLWLGRHIFALKRAFIDGERFVRAHPVFDLGALIIIGAIWTLTRTVGLIQ